MKKFSAIIVILVLVMLATSLIACTPVVDPPVIDPPIVEPSIDVKMTILDKKATTVISFSNVLREQPYISSFRYANYTSFIWFYLDIDNSTNPNLLLQNLDFTLQFDEYTTLAINRKNLEPILWHNRDFAIDHSPLRDRNVINFADHAMHFMNQNYLHDNKTIPANGKDKFIVFFSIPHNSDDQVRTFKNTQFTLSMLTTDFMSGKKTCLNTIEIPIATEQA